MKKRLEIQVDKIDWAKNFVSFHVTEQSHRCKMFAQHLNSTFPAGKLSIISALRPEFRAGLAGTILYVKGEFEHDDNLPIVVAFSDFANILEAIQAYNAFEFPDLEPEKHKIVFEGKTIEISAASYKALKDSLGA